MILRGIFKRNPGLTNTASSASKENISSPEKANTEPPVPLNRKKIKSLSRERLKEELGKRRHPKSGNKNALINRLTEWIRNSRQNPSPAVTPGPTQPVCVDLDGTLCNISCPTLNNGTGVSLKHILSPEDA